MDNESDFEKIVWGLKDKSEVISIIFDNDLWTVKIRINVVTGTEPLDQARSFSGYDENDYMSVKAFYEIADGVYIYEMKRVKTEGK